MKNPLSHGRHTLSVVGEQVGCSTSEPVHDVLQSRHEFLLAVALNLPAGHVAHGLSVAEPTVLHVTVICVPAGHTERHGRQPDPSVAFL
jgi:hypothetical protein